MNTVGFVASLWQDLRYGLRVLRRNPTFAAVAILTLALGTGANTAIFQLVNAVRLQSLPVAHPDQLAEIRIVKAPHGRTGQFNGRWPMLSYPLYERIRDEQQVFTDVVAWGSTTFDLSRGGEIRPAEGLWVSGNFFSGLGVPPAAGRLLAPADDVKGCGAPGVVLGYPFWQREYGGDPGCRRPDDPARRPSPRHRRRRLVVVLRRGRGPHVRRRRADLRAPDVHARWRRARSLRCLVPRRNRAAEAGSHGGAGRGASRRIVEADPGGDGARRATRRRTPGTTSRCSSARCRRPRASPGCAAATATRSTSCWS